MRVWREGESSQSSAPASRSGSRSNSLSFDDAHDDDDEQRTGAAGGSASGMVKIVDEIEEGNLFAADPAIALVGAYGAALVKVSAHVGEQDEPG